MAHLKATSGSKKKTRKEIPEWASNLDQEIDFFSPTLSQFSAEEIAQMIEVREFMRIKNNGEMIKPKKGGTGGLCPKEANQINFKIVFSLILIIMFLIILLIVLIIIMGKRTP